MLTATWLVVCSRIESGSWACLQYTLTACKGIYNALLVLVHHTNFQVLEVAYS